MKIFTVNGITGSGKTTTIEMIIKELRARGRSVGSVKDIHFEGFAIDKPGGNTDRHRKAGSMLVTARGLKETDILYRQNESMENILCHYDNYDYIVLEGVLDMEVPQILTAHEKIGEKEILELEERKLKNTICYAGRMSNVVDEYEGLPVFNATEDIAELVDFIEEKVSDYDPEIGFELNIEINGEKITEDLDPIQKLLMKRAFSKYVLITKLERSGYIREKVFKSKKNEVYIAEKSGKKYVIKLHKDDRAAEYEKEFLTKLKAAGVNVPSIVKQTGEALVLEYIEGQPLNEVLEEEEDHGGDFEPILNAMIDWLSDYYRNVDFVSSVGDINLRNFILTGNGQIYGVDFESGEGYNSNPEEDTGRICAFMESYDPSFTSWKKNAKDHFITSMIRECDLDAELIDKAYLAEMENIKKRRIKDQ